LIKLNYSKISKKTIRISWYNREPNNFRNHPEYNIFVKRIPSSVNSREFHDYFSKFGSVVSAKLVEDDEGEIVGYGFVLYDNEEAANNAIKEANNKEWKGKTLFVARFVKNKPKKAPQFNTVYVKNIPKVSIPFYL
jgi:polyadenylate-binding protein